MPFINLEDFAESRIGEFSLTDGFECGGLFINFVCGHRTGIPGRDYSVKINEGDCCLVVFEKK